MQYELLDLLKTRRSIRQFKDKQISKETIEQIIKAGLLAPSSKNKRPVEFVVVEDKDTIKKLKKCKGKGVDSLNTATCAIAVIADSEKSDVWVEDASIAMTLMHIAAENLGLGSVWIQIRNRFVEGRSSEEEVRRVLNIPDNYGVLSILAIGYKDEHKDPYDEGSLDFSKVHTNRY